MINRGNLINKGVVKGYDPQNDRFVLISNGYISVRAVITGGQSPQIGQTYLVYKNGATYFLGARIG